MDGKRRTETKPAAPGGGGEWVRQNLGFQPDAKQARVLRSSIRRGLLNCTRQWGKSTVTAAQKRSPGADPAEQPDAGGQPSARQSGEFVRKAAKFVRR